MTDGETNRAYDTGMNRLWDNLNKGVSLQILHGASRSELN